jgi:hypothetical protein
VAARNFVVEPDIFIAYPINRAFVEGRTEYPPLVEYWSASLLSLLVSAGLLAVGLGFIPISFGEDIAFMRSVLPLFGLFSLIGDFYLVYITLRLYNGLLIEGRVVEASIRPHPSRPNRRMQHITVEFQDPQGQKHVAVRMRGNDESRPMPKVGTQAAVLFATPNIRRIM